MNHSLRFRLALNALLSARDMRAERENMKTQIQRTTLVAMATIAISILPITLQGQRLDAEKTPSPPGTYYSAQSWDSPKRPLMAPLPFNPFPELPVYSIGEGRFLYDDREVDYAALRKEATEKAAVEGVAGVGLPNRQLEAGDLRCPLCTLATWATANWRLESRWRRPVPFGTSTL